MDRGGRLASPPLAMTFHPSRRRGVLLGGVLLALLFGVSLLGVYQLGARSLSPWTVLWAILPLAAAPAAAAVAYRLYGLITAYYFVNRDGILLRWGLRLEQIPMPAVVRLQSAGKIDPAPRLRPGLWWPGCMVGQCSVEGMGTVEFMAAGGAAHQVVITSPAGNFSISPSDLEGFKKAYLSASRQGSTEPIEPLSIRPDFLLARVWSDRWARMLILTGLTLPLLLLGYLAFRAPGLPETVPFGFDAQGVPALYAPPGRLLLLPMVGLVVWMADAALGAWLLRREPSPVLSYALWSAAIAVGGMLWAAVGYLVGLG